MRPMRKRQLQPKVKNAARRLELDEQYELGEKLVEQRERQRLGKLITQARLDAGLQNHKQLADRIINPQTGKPFHLNTIAAWEKGDMRPSGYLHLIEDATGKPRGWFELQLDPIGHVIQLADEVAEIKRLVERLALKLL